MDKYCSFLALGWIQGTEVGYNPEAPLDYLFEVPSRMETQVPTAVTCSLTQLALASFLFLNHFPTSFASCEYLANKLLCSNPCLRDFLLGEPNPRQHISLFKNDVTCHTNIVFHWKAVLFGNQQSTVLNSHHNAPGAGGWCFRYCAIVSLLSIGLWLHFDSSSYDHSSLVFLTRSKASDNIFIN